MSQGYTKGTPIDTDPTMSANSNLVTPSQAAVVTYVANTIAGSVTNVTATAPMTSTGGATPNLAMPQAATAQSGYLSSTDWNTFNGKASASDAIAYAIALG